MQSGKKILCAALSLLILAVLLLPNREAYAYTAPDFRDAEFHEAAAMIGDRVKLDVSCLDQGYVAVSAVSNMRLKFQVVKDETTYNYDLPSDGTPGIFPLQGGNGSYRFRVMENVVDKKYSELYSSRFCGRALILTIPGTLTVSEKQRNSPQNLRTNSAWWARSIILYAVRSPMTGKKP